MAEQLTLSGFHLRAHATFDNFFEGPNDAIVSQLKLFAELKSEQFIYLWGQTGTGRSHLLQACCHHADQAGFTSIYLPMNDIKHMSSEFFEEMESFDLICLDDVDLIAEQPEWEEAIFHFYNRLREADVRFIVSGNTLPKDLAIQLPDLCSRLAWGVTFRLEPLGDDALVKALQLGARTRGFELPDDVGQFLLRRYARSTNVLFPILDRLDHVSLAEKRRLTIPFVKEVLGRS